MNAVLQIAAFREPGIADALDAWADQPEPSWASVDYEAWVTPDGAKEACQTWQVADAHPVFEAHEAPQYKLRARNAAHGSALERGYDAIVSCDADAPPLGRGTLSALLERLSAPGAAAVCAWPSSPPSPLGIFSNVKTRAREVVFRSIHGQCHAMTAEAWSHAGPFADDIDHTSLHPVWMEEEFRFGRRLRDVGRVEYAKDAKVYDDTRRMRCRLQRSARRPRSDYCEKPEGNDTFAPR